MSGVKSSARLLWLVVAAGVLAYWRVQHADDGTVEAVRKASRQAPREPVSEVCVSPRSMPERGPMAMRAAGDPFSAPPPPPVPTPKAVTPPPVVAVAEPPPPPPPPEPKLPFKFLGMFVDPGHPTRVFLGLGDNLITAAPGDVLEGGFKLEKIGPKDIEFVHLQRKLVLRMPIEGDRL